MRASTTTWLVCIALAAAGAYVWKPWQKRDKPEANFETTKVERSSVIAKVTASGTLSALVTVQVGSQVSGRIKELNVDFNSVVKKGEVIAKIDPQLFEAALEQARANLAVSQGDLAKASVQAAEATRQYTRTKSLAERKLIADAELDTAQANAEAAGAAIVSAKARVAQTQAALHQAQVNLTYTTILSPIDGVVISRSVDVGQTVAASLQTPTLFVIAENLHKMQVDTSVAEADIGKLRDGMQATFTVDAYPQQRFVGSVRQIRNAATNVQNVITYDAVIDVENPELQLKPGMTANVSFVYAERKDVLVIANAALRFRPTPEMLGEKTDATGEHGTAGTASAQLQKPVKKPERGTPISDKRTLWVLRGGKPVAVDMRIGLTDGARTELVEGTLREGDLVITDAAVGGSASPMGGQMPMRRIL